MALLRCILVAVSILLLSGCQNDSGKAIVSGKITFDGKAVENGDIMFYPAEGTIGPVSGASIKDGKYIVDAKGGVPHGQHTVKIRAFDVSRTEELTPEQMDMPGQRVQYIPAIYNEETTLTATIQAGLSKLEDLDFELKAVKID